MYPGLKLALNIPGEEKLHDTHKVTDWISKHIKGKKAQPVHNSKVPTQLHQEHKLEQISEPTLEDLLLLRSRRTVSRSGDISGTVSLIEDESSILEGRCLVNYTSMTNIASSSNTANDISVALVPKGTMIEDMIVALKGGRVPFIVRRALPLGDRDEDDPVLPLMFCELIGECFVNGYRELDSVFVPEIAENGKGDYEFVFGDALKDKLMWPGHMAMRGS